LEQIGRLPVSLGRGPNICNGVRCLRGSIEYHSLRLLVCFAAERVTYLSRQLMLVAPRLYYPNLHLRRWFHSTSRNSNTDNKDKRHDEGAILLYRPGERNGNIFGYATNIFHHHRCNHWGKLNMSALDPRHRQIGTHYFSFADSLAFSSSPDYVFFLCRHSHSVCMARSKHQ
jgi:hypothetical protein